MEHKTWRWRKKSSEKTIIDDGTVSLSLERNADEDQERVVPRKCSSNLSDESALITCDCNAKDELVRKHAGIVEQALAGQKKAGEDVAYVKQELEKTMKQGEAAEQKLATLNAALNECMQEIECLQVEQKAIVDPGKEKKLEGKLAEANKRVANLSAENANLMKALLCKEKLVQDLDKGKAELEDEIGMLMERVDSAEKENTFLKYEFRVIDKELKESHRLELENITQIKKLEAECQQLRNLLRKRLQVPSVPLDMKKTNPSMRPVEKVFNLEEENKILKEILALNDGELQSWKVKYGQMASRVAELKEQLNELSEAENSMKLAISGLGLRNFDEVRNSESWSNALVEFEHYRQEKTKNEPLMEKFAIITTGNRGSGNELQSNSKVVVPTSADKGTSWLDEILQVILEEHRLSERNLDELLEDILIALGYMRKNASVSSEISGLLTWESSDYARPNEHMNDASFSREKIRRCLSFDRSKSENHLEIDSPNSHDTLSQLIASQLTVIEENRQMKDKLQRVTEENEALRNQLEEEKQTIESLQREIESLNESKGLIEEQVENQRLMNEDLDTQLTVSKSKFNEILRKLSSLEVELEHKRNYCEELEATCLELQLQLETCRISTKEPVASEADLLAKELRNETIQDVAKQLKALPSPDVTQFDDTLTPVSTAITIPNSSNSSITDKKSLVTQRSTLRDRMMEEESSNEDSSEKQSVNDIEFRAPLPPPPGLKVQPNDQVSNLALVPSKKSSGGFGFIARLFFKRKKGGSKIKAATLQHNTNTLMAQRDLLVVV